jgi:hypothetical protein
MYILNVCGTPHAYRDRAGQGGFDFVEVPMPADAGPPPLVLPKRAPEEDESQNQAPTASDAGVPDAAPLNSGAAGDAPDH